MLTSYWAILRQTIRFMGSKISICTLIWTASTQLAVSTPTICHNPHMAITMAEQVRTLKRNTILPQQLMLSISKTSTRNTTSTLWLVTNTVVWNIGEAALTLTIIQWPIRELSTTVLPRLVLSTILQTIFGKDKLFLSAGLAVLTTRSLIATSLLSLSVPTVQAVFPTDIVGVTSPQPLLLGVLTTNHSWEMYPVSVNWNCVSAGVRQVSKTLVWNITLRPIRRQQEPTVFILSDLTILECCSDHWFTTMTWLGKQPQRGM